MNWIGFSHEFYDEYHKVHPRSSPYYDQRQKLYELYHHLNVRSLLAPYNALLLIDVTYLTLDRLGMNSTRTCLAGVINTERWGL